MVFCVRGLTGVLDQTTRKPLKSCGPEDTQLPADQFAFDDPTNNGAVYDPILGQVEGFRSD